MISSLVTDDRSIVVSVSQHVEFSFQFQSIIYTYNVVRL